MRYVCSKNYKILCKEDCYHVDNIKEENKVWFATISDGIKYGCRPCKHCMSHFVTIPSCPQITQEQADVLYEFAKTPVSVEVWKNLGYTEEEAQELSKASVIYK